MQHSGNFEFQSNQSSAAAAEAYSKPNSSCGSDDEEDGPLTILEQITSKREMFQDATYELQLLEEEHAARVLYRKKTLRSWPEWRRKLYHYIKPNSWFERIVFIVILVNCVTISTDNFASISEYSTTIQAVEDACTFIFLIEMVLKMVGLGVFLKKDGYFSSWWNALDCLIVLVGLGLFIVRMAAPDLRDGGVSVARAFRVLRPFRTLSALGSLRTILRSIGSSLMRLTHVLTLSVIFTVVAGLIALQFFHGALSHRCYDVRYNPINFTVMLDFEDDVARVCSTSYLPYNLTDTYPTAPAPPTPTSLPWGPPCCEATPTNLSNTSTWSPEWYCPGGPGTTAAGIIGFNGSVVPFTDFTAACTVSTDPNISSPPYLANFPFVTTSEIRSNIEGVSRWFSRDFIQFSTFPPPGSGLTPILTGAAASQYAASMGMSENQQLIRNGISEGFVKLHRNELPKERTGHVCEYGKLCLKAPNPDGGEMDFDHIMAALVTLYTILSLEGWSQVMYYTIDALGITVAWYFVLMVLVGAIVVLNLALTILTDSFSRSVAVEEELNNRMKLGAHHADENPDGFVDIDMEGRTKTVDATTAARESRITTSSAAKLRASSAVQAIQRGTIYKRFQDVRVELHSRIVKAKWLNFTMSFLGLVNLCLLATIYEGATENHRNGVIVSCKVITCLFCLEALVVLCCTPLDRFSRSTGVAVKILLGVGATIEWFVSERGAVSAFYALRVLYVLRRLKRLRVTLRYLYTAMKATVSLVALLLILVFLFALIGMQMFAGTVCGRDTTTTLQSDTSLCTGVPRTNFDNIGYGVVTVFIIVAGDGWRDIMHLYMSAVGDYAAIYFCLCYLLGGYIVINLFVAVLFSFGAEEDQVGVLQQDDNDIEVNDDDDGSEPGQGNLSEWLADTNHQPRRISLSDADMLGTNSNLNISAINNDVDHDVEMDLQVGDSVSGDYTTTPLPTPRALPRRRGESRVRIDSVIDIQQPSHPPQHQQQQTAVHTRTRSRSTKSIGGLLGHKQSMGTFLAARNGRRRGGSDASNRSRMSDTRGGGGEVTHFLNRHKDRYKRTKSSNKLLPNRRDSDTNLLPEPRRSSLLGESFRRSQSKSSLKTTLHIPAEFADITPVDLLTGDSGAYQPDEDEDELERTTRGKNFQRKKSRKNLNRVTAFGNNQSSTLTAQPEEEAVTAPEPKKATNMKSILVNKARDGAKKMGTVLKSLEEFTRVENADQDGGGNELEAVKKRTSTNQRTSLESSSMANLDSSLLHSTSHRSGMPSSLMLQDDVDEASSPTSTLSPQRHRGLSAARKAAFGDRDGTGELYESDMAGAGKAGGMNDARYFAYLQQRLQDKGLGRIAAILTQFQHICGLIVTSRPFSWFMLVVVMYAMINLALYDPITYPDSPSSNFDRWTDLLSAILFLLEALLKVGYLGLYTTQSERLLTGRPDAYFNSLWNALDFTLMIIGIVPAIGFFYMPSNAFASAVQTMRVARALRPLSFIGRHQGLRVIFTSLLNAIPAIGNISVFTILVWCIFSVSAMQLFGGRLEACSSQDSWGDATYGPLHLVTAASCEAAGYEWRSPTTNYDNFGNSLLTLFMVATVDNWHPIMYQAADTWAERGITVTPNNRPYIVIFFIAYVVVMNFFLINFFVSVMVDTYFITKAQMELVLREFYKDKLLSPEQADFVKLYRRALIFVKPPLHVTIEAGTLRHIFRRIARSRNFEYVFLGLATLQTILLSTRFAEEPPMSYQSLFYVDAAFTGAFWTVLCIKVSVLGIRSFFEQHTRRLELFINCLALGSIIAEAITGPNTACQLLRMVHVIRLYRAIYLNDSMRMLVETIAVSAPSFLKVFFILFMIFYVFTVFGMVLFGRVRWDGTNSAGINYNANFQRFDVAMVTLLRVATVDDWAELMEACAVTEGYDRCDARVGDCGQPVIARIFFPLMVILLQWIGLNFFTAALMDSFSTTEKDERYAVQKRDVAAFRRQWKALVDLNTSMSLVNLQQFMSKLGAPLGPELDREYHQEVDAVTGELMMKAPPKLGFLDILKFLSVLDLPLYGGTHASQADVFDALIRLYYGVPLPKHVNREVQRLSRRRFEVGQFERFTELGSPDSPLAHSMRREGDTSKSPKMFVHIRHAAAAAMIQAKWRGSRVRRIAIQITEQNRRMMEEHGVTPAALERTKKERQRRERLLARPIGTEML